MARHVQNSLRTMVVILLSIYALQIKIIISFYIRIYLYIIFYFYIVYCIFFLLDHRSVDYSDNKSKHMSGVGPKECGR